MTTTKGPERVETPDAKAGSARMFKVECACGVEFKCQGMSALRRRTLAHRRGGCSEPIHVERIKS